MTWVPLKKSDSVPVTVESKPVRKLELTMKPRMDIKGASMSLPADARASLFGSSVKTVSTNMHSDSTITMGNAGFTDFNVSFGRRTSIQFNMRRQTLPNKLNAG